MMYVGMCRGMYDGLNHDMYDNDVNKNDAKREKIKSSSVNTVNIRLEKQ